MDKYKFAGIMIANRDRQEDLAKYLGISNLRFNAKINEYKGAQFTQMEIRAIVERYKLTAEQVMGIFCQNGILKRYKPKGENHEEGMC